MTDSLLEYRGNHQLISEKEMPIDFSQKYEKEKNNSRTYLP